MLERVARFVRNRTNARSGDPESYDVLAWVDMANQHHDALPEATRQLMQEHDSRRGAHVITVFAPEIAERLREPLTAAQVEISSGASPERALPHVIEEIVRWKSIVQCRDAHTAGGYYDDAEQYMAGQWERVIEPMVRDLDFRHVLEIAPGHGRNTEFLRRRAQSIFLVDVNQTCIDACRERFGEARDGCRFFYGVTDGNGVPMVPDASITLVYTFDSMVHFDKLIVRDYVREIRRVLRPGGCAVLHHSNLGQQRPNSDWARNIGNRSEMTAEIMRGYADEAGLNVRFQRSSGIADGWGMDDLDCFTILERS